VPGEWNPYPYLWQGLTTEPLTALNNRTSGVFCGKVVGGGTTANAMNWLRYAGKALKFRRQRSGAEALTMWHTEVTARTSMLSPRLETRAGIGLVSLNIRRRQVKVAEGIGGVAELG
jgi:hypothetical protein